MGKKITDGDGEEVGPRLRAAREPNKCLGKGGGEDSK